MNKKRLNKKGGVELALETIIRTTIWVLVFFLVLGVVYYIIDRGGDLGRETICRDSVLVRQQASINYAGTNKPLIEKPTPLLCSPLDKKTLKGDRESVKRQIADLSAKCWWMYAEGTIGDLFQNEQGEKGCNVCYFFKIEDGLDEGVKSTREFFKEESRVLNDDRITAPEMYNFLIDNDYNAKLAYGGGTKHYISDDYEFSSSYDVTNPSTISLSDIEMIPDNYVLDYSGKISKDTTDKIKSMGDWLIQKDKGRLLVVVADEIKRHDKSTTRMLIEDLGLDSDKNVYDAILVTIDLENEQIRLTMGISLEQYVYEFELQELMKKQFSSKIIDINPPLQNFLEDIKKTIDSNANEYFRTMDIGQKSYYSYLTNQGTTIAIMNEIEAGKTYAISYASTSNDLSWWQGILQSFDNGGGKTVGIIALGAGVTVVAASVILSGGLTLGLVAAAVNTVIVGGASSVGIAYATQSTHDFANGLFALAGAATEDKPNFIMVTQLTDVSGHCRIE